MASHNILKYEHGPLNESIVAIGGSFQITEEKRFIHRDKEILYLLALAHVDNACCGSWGCGYALVKGYIKNWKLKEIEDDYAVTEFVPVEDPDEKEAIRKRIMSEEMVQQVVFT